MNEEEEKRRGSRRTRRRGMGAGRWGEGERGKEGRDSYGFRSPF